MHTPSQRRKYTIALWSLSVGCAATALALLVCLVLWAGWQWWLAAFAPFIVSILVAFLAITNWSGHP